MMPIHTSITATGLSRFHRFLRSAASSTDGSVVGDAAPRRIASICSPITAEVRHKIHQAPLFELSGSLQQCARWQGTLSTHVVSKYARLVWTTRESPGGAWAGGR